jgi:hypothetical protein
MTENSDYERLCRFAFSVMEYMPDDTKSALAVLDLVRELIEWRARHEERQPAAVVRLCRTPDDPPAA